MKHQALFVSIGESFRTGSQNSRVRGLPESVPEQVEALKSHIELLNSQSTKPTLKVLTYKTPFSDLIKQHYSEFSPEITEFEHPIGYNNLVANAINLARETAPPDGWDFVFIFRIDLILKDKLSRLFNPQTGNVLYPSVCWARDSRLFNGRHRVNDMFLFVPRDRLLDLYEGRIPLNHNACEHMPADLYSTVSFFWIHITILTQRKIKIPCIVSQIDQNQPFGTQRG